MSEAAVCLPPRYCFQALLGAGAYGQVVLATDLETTVKVAIKKTHSTTSNRPYLIKAAKNEEDILRKIKGKDTEGFVVKLIAAEMFNNDHYMCLELCHHDLFVWMRRKYPEGIPLSVMKTICRRLFSVMSFLKKQNIIHGDIKQDNFLMMNDDPSSIKITDFGLSVRLAQRGVKEVLPTKLGCLFFRCPDAVLGYPSDYAADMWSLGCMLYSIVTVHYSFYSADEFQLMNGIMKVFGMPPTDLLDRAKRTDYFFDTTISSDTKYVPVFLQGSDWQRKAGVRQLFDRIALKTVTPGLSHTTLVTERFFDLIQRLLTYDPSQRLTPDLALSHSFVCED